MAEIDNGFKTIIQEAMESAHEHFDDMDLIFDDNKLLAYTGGLFRGYSSFDDMSSDVSMALLRRNGGFSGSDNPRVLNAAFASVRTFRMMYDLYIADETKRMLDAVCQKNAGALNISNEEIPDAIEQMRAYIDARLDEQYADEIGWETISVPMRELFTKTYDSNCQYSATSDPMAFDLTQCMGRVLTLNTMGLYKNMELENEHGEIEKRIDVDIALDSFRRVNRTGYSGLACDIMADAVEAYAHELDKAGNKFNMNDYTDWFCSNVNKANITAIFDIDCAKNKAPQDFIEHYKNGELTDEDKQWAESVYDTYVNDFLPAQLGAMPEDGIRPTDFISVGSGRRERIVQEEDPNYAQAKHKIVGKMLTENGIIFSKENMKDVECVPILNDKEKLGIFEMIWELLSRLFGNTTERQLNREYMQSQNKESEKVFEKFENNRKKVTFESLLGSDSIKNKTVAKAEQAENALEHTQHGMQ